MNDMRSPASSVRPLLRSILPLLLLGLAALPAAAAPEPDRILQFELRVPTPPVPVRAGGKTRLVYELHITNLDPKGHELELAALDVLAEGRETPLLHLDGAGLDAVLKLPGLPDLKDKKKLGGGLRAVAFLWVDLDGPAPAVLVHRLTIHGQSGDKSLDGGRTAVPAGAPLALGPPLRGGRWVATNGPANTSLHRRTMLSVDGLPRIAQRFAIDWMKLGEDGLLFHGDSKKNESWVCYGSEVLAVADGTVASVKDGIPQNTPLAPEMAVPITLDTIGGNFVILDVGDGRYAFYAHLQPGSLRVKPGDKVRRGQVLGLLGNSGNSDVPHLHFHLADANNPLGAEGLPYVLAEFWVQGAVESNNDDQDFKPWKPAGAEERRTGEIPLKDAVVRFP